MRYAEGICRSRPRGADVAEVVSRSRRKGVDSRALPLDIKYCLHCLWLGQEVRNNAAQEEVRFASWLAGCYLTTCGIAREYLGT
jgi:hypothetical protein